MPKHSKTSLKKVKIDEKFLQLDRYLQRTGQFSRREAERIIKSGKVTVDGKRETRPFRRVNVPVETVRVKGEIVEFASKHIYMVLNKPIGYVCTHIDDSKYKTIYELLPKDRHIFSVGRLDVETAGLLIITSDGEFSRRMELPEYGIERVYKARLEGNLDQSQIRRARRGLLLDNQRTKPIRIKKLGKCPGGEFVRVTVSEGKYHEVRRIFDKFQTPVISLVRLEYGTITVEGLAPGNWRAMTHNELETMKEKLGLVGNDA
ncbi:MAG: pseudouridine synthase [Candidatus Zixiibacteriota bacterium]